MQPRSIDVRSRLFSFFAAPQRDRRTCEERFRGSIVRFFPFFCCYCCCCVPFFLPEFQTAQSLDPDREDQKEERPFASSCRLCLFLLVLTLLSCAVFRFGAKSAGKKAEKRYKCAKIGNVDGKPRSPRAAKCRIVCAATALRWLC